MYTQNRKSHDYQGRDNMPPKRSCSLPLLPLTPLPSSSSFRMQSRRERGHKLRSLSSKINRRSRSSNILLSAFQKISSVNKRDERSTMSLCSVTSDEYDLDDTIMDSFDDTIECDDVRSTTLYPVPSQPTFPLFTRGNYPSTSISQESWVVTPPTPTRLTLKMRPSSFILPFVGDEFYAKYDESEEYSDDEFVYSIDNRARAHWDFRTAGNNVFTAQPNQIPTTISTTESVHSAIASDSVSFDENDENENIVPPSTPPSRYHDDITNPRFITSPPMIRLIPKRVVYLPFHSHDNYSHNDHNSAGSIIDNYDERSTVPSFHPNLHHLLLPDDF